MTDRVLSSLMTRSLPRFDDNTDASLYSDKGKRNKKVNVTIVSITLSQLCDLTVSAHLRLHGTEPAVSCRHSSVMWVGGKATPRPHTAVTFPAFRPVPNYTAW